MRQQQQQQKEYTTGRWRLSDLLPDDGKDPYVDLRNKLNDTVRRFESLRPKLDGFDRGSLVSALHTLEKVNEVTSIMSSHAYMRFSEDTRDQNSSSLLAKVQDVLADADNRTLFFRLWWTGLPERRTKSLLPDNPDYVYFLERLRQRAPHTLKEEVEQAINLKNTTGVSGWIRHYEQLTSEFTYHVKVKGRLLKDKRGRPKKFVTSSLLQLVYSPDPAVRKAAYTTLFRKYAEYGRHLGEIYRNIVKDWYNENVTLRHFSSPIAARNLENDISNDAVETLLSVCRKNSTVFQEFFRVKAKLLGVPKLRRYDIYAPLKHSESHTTFSDAVKTVIAAFRRFDTRFASLAGNIFDQGHVDSEVRPGKLSSAYCAYVVPHVTPYILLSYNGSTRAIYTIAHESGHGVHAQLASSHSILTYSPPLVLAETASVFGEMLLYDSMMENVKDEAIIRNVLEEKLSETYATVQRQAYLVVFEVAAHKAIQEGSTADDLCKTYFSVLREQFGDAVDVPDEFKWEWTYIPHIYRTPFYCYAYSFGNLLSLALYNTYREQGRSFVPKYMEILRAGGAESPAKILKEVGADVESVEFWQRGYDVLKEMTSQLSGLS